VAPRALLLGILALVACGGSSSDRDASPTGNHTTVVRHVDGDTFWVGDRERVRLIGVDTPETDHPSRAVECFGAEAGGFLGDLLPLGTEVRLEYDVERQDRYGRTLAYVYRAEDGLFVNGELVRAGYAQVYTAPPNVAHADEFLAFQRQAREAGRGLWSACGDVAAPPTTPSTTPPAAGGCDASYPDLCLPPPPPDLDCGDVDERRFRVEGADPHNFDGDRNGVGCEEPRS
jgi:micrococcal nuclease